MRKVSWRDDLAEFLQQSKELRFEWGTNDCALWAFKGVEQVTGDDFYSRYAGRYTTAAGSLRVLKKEGFSDHIAAANAYLKARIQPSFAGAGDIGAVASDEGLALGIVFGRGIYVMTTDGLGLKPASEILMAWRVQ